LHYFLSRVQQHFLKKERKMNHLNTRSIPLLLKAFLIAFTAGMMLSGCGATKQARDVKHKGYLVDASILRKGGEGEALYVYRNPKADWPSYSKMLLDPVITLRKAELNKQGVPLEDLQRMADNFYVTLYSVLKKDYEMVTTPGPRTLRLQVTLTDLQGSWATTDTVTSVIPVGMVLSKGTEFVTGKPAFVGEATVEVKVTDARTGQLLAAGIDRRVGGDNIEASVDTWDDVNKIMELWAKWFRFRLCKSRDETDCFQPKQ
jgi:hypothetical protein